MPELTSAHREDARRALIVGGYPRPDSDGLAQVRWGAVLEAVATAIAIAEVRGPAGGRTDPTDAEETAYRHGLGQAFAEALAVLTAPDPAASIRHIARSYGVDRDLDGPPTSAAAQALRDGADDQRRSAAQDRLSWTGGEGLIITPPPGQEER